MLVALILPLMVGATGSPSIVQPSVARVRQWPSNASRVLGEVLIGSTCQVIRQRADGWLRVSCGELNGFLPSDALGAEAPTYDGCLKTARDPATPPQERLKFGLRAMALAPGDAAASQATRDAFIDAELAVIATDKLVPTGIRPCKRGPADDGCVQEVLRAAGLLTGISQWQRVTLRNDNFVAYEVIDAQLSVVSGSYSRHESRTSAQVLYGHKYKIDLTVLMSVALIGRDLSHSKPPAADDPIWSEIKRSPWQAAKLFGGAPDVNAVDGAGEPPIVWAARNGDREAVKALLRRGANLNRTSETESALTAAISKGADDLVTLLVRAGAPVRVVPPSGKTPLMAAAERQIEQVQRILELTPGDDINAVDGLGQSALMLAAGAGKEANVRALLELKADPSLADDDGNTALLRAAATGSAPCIEALLKAGASPVVVNLRGESALRLLARKGSSTALLQVLAAITPGQGTTPLVEPVLAAAARACDLALLDALARFHPRGEEKLDGRPAMVLGVRCDPAVLERMIAIGANVNAAAEDGTTALQVALDDSKTKPAALVLLKAHANPNSVAKNGQRPLALAVELKDVELVKLLLKAGADPKQPLKPPRGGSILMRGPSMPILEALVGAGAPLELADVDGWTPVMARFSKIEEVEYLISHGAKTDFVTTDGWTPMMIFARDGYTPLVARLLKAGSPPNFQNPRGETALLFAAGNRQAETAKVLLDAGAKVDLASKEGKTPLVAALEATTYPVGEQLIVHDPDSMATVKLLLDRKATWSGRDQYRHTPLGVAAYWGKLEVVKLLLDRGAPIDGAEPQGDLPLCAAAGEKRLEVARLLIERGANVNARQSRPSILRCEMTSPLLCAVQLGSLETVKLLLDSGAMPNGPEGVQGCTPLMAAVAGADQETKVPLLLSQGADVNRQDADGRTALHYAVAGGQCSGGPVVQMLLKAKAKPDLRDAQRRTPLLTYLQRITREGGGEFYDGCNEVLRLLVAAGADLGAADSGGTTPRALGEKLYGRSRQALFGAAK